MTKEIKIERVGGFGGFGLPGSRIESKGKVDLEHLSAADRDAVEKLFTMSHPRTASSPDAFRYRLTRNSAAGDETVEVEEHQVPHAIRDRVKDRLK